MSKIDYNNMKVQVYYLDMGVYRKAYIQTMDLRCLNALNRRKRHIGFILAADDPYGNRLPNTIRPDMSNEEEQMLDEALIKTYADFGITHDNNSIYLDTESTPPKLKRMPILGDLHKHLLENPMTARLAAIISRFVTGSAQSFNQQTNVDLSNKYIVLAASRLTAAARQFPIHYI